MPHIDVYYELYITYRNLSSLCFGAAMKHKPAMPRIRSNVLNGSNLLNHCCMSSSLHSVEIRPTWRQCVRCPIRHPSHGLGGLCRARARPPCPAALHRPTLPIPANRRMWMPVKPAMQVTADNLKGHNMPTIQMPT